MNPANVLISKELIMVDEQSGEDHSFLNNPGGLADKVSRFKLTDDDLGAVDFAKQGQERRTLAAAGKMGLKFVIAGTESQLDQFNASMQNLPKGRIAELWQGLFERDVDAIDLNALSQSGEVDGRFRVKPDNNQSPILPGLMKEALRQSATALQHKVNLANSPDLVAAAFEEHLHNYPIQDWASNNPGVVGIYGGFWNEDNTQATNMLLPLIDE